MIAGLEEVTSGDIEIGEQRVNDIDPSKRGIAMVFQTYALYPHMSVRENMGFALRCAGVPKPEIKKQVDEAARILELEPLMNRRPKELSGGQRQRVAIGRAIVRHPQVFLFDEPLSNLDAMLRVQMRVELKRLHERLETTAIYVTHDQVEAMTLGDRVVVMKDGWVQQVGEPLELYGKPANRFVAGFIGSPAMNFVSVLISASGGELWADAEGLRIKVPPPLMDRMRAHAGKRATLGVRPEALHPATGADPADCCFETTVDVVEPLGNEILNNFRAGGAPMVARVDPAIRVKAHQSMRVALDPERIHFFDEKSEAAI
jgi:multiple sugar transport system ATP-binding protein